MGEIDLIPENLPILDQVRLQYPAIGQLTYTLDDSWDMQGKNLTECLGSFCQRIPSYRKRLVDEATVWLSWTDSKLETYTKSIIIFNFWANELTREFQTARSFWQAVIEIIQYNLRRCPA